MNRERYDLIGDITNTNFYFFSIGPKGVIWKKIEFKHLDNNQYNLCFGDWDDPLQKIDDLARTNNKDRDKVFNTIASAVVEFLKHYPGACVSVRGSTPARTRLFQMLIKANWIELSMVVDIYGYLNGEWRQIDRQKKYEAFMASKIKIF